jgi:hypothetical protein
MDDTEGLAQNGAIECLFVMSLTPRSTVLAMLLNV